MYNELKFVLLLLLLVDVNCNANNCRTYHTIVHFPQATAKLTKKSREELDVIKNKDILMGSWVIEGHSSQKEKQERQLSKLRANVVFEYLAPTNGNIWVHWYGSTKKGYGVVEVTVTERCY